MVEAILWRAGLPTDSDRPDAYAARHGLGAAKFRYAEEGGPSCSVGPAEPDGGVRGQGWGETGREAFLAALADALEPGG